MRYLLDTHVVLWVAFDDAQISQKAREVLLTEDAEIFLSATSFWEISIKYRLGKLDLKSHTPETLLEGFKRNFECRFLDLDFDDAVSFFNLGSDHHKDPFDRMLVWQALRRKLSIISNDEKIHAYKDTGLKLIW
jgi:PIN domain nuclease of toxin-antitoxin system